LIATVVISGNSLAVEVDLLDCSTLTLLLLAVDLLKFLRILILVLVSGASLRVDGR